MGRKSKQNTSTPDLALENEVAEFQHARNVICERLERFKQFLDTKRDEIFQIEVRLKSVEEDFSAFNKIQTRLEFLVSEEKRYRLDTESDFYALIATAKRIIADQKKNDQNILTENPVKPLSNLSTVAKLPDLDLPSFYGKYETWYSFKNIFDSVVHKQTDLSDIDKFLYLKICCKADALRVIDSLDVTSANYSIALGLLQKRYENKRAIVNHHVNNLLLIYLRFLENQLLYLEVY